MKTRTIKYLSDQEKNELFEVIKKDNSICAVRNRAIFYLAEYCALRVSEVGEIRISDYNKNLGQIYCKRKKGSRDNTIRILDDEVLESLNFYLEERLNLSFDSNVLFISKRGLPISRKTLDCIMKSYCSSTSIPLDKRHFHVLKHTRAIELGNYGLDLKDIQWWLGHTNIENTQIYAQFTTYQQNYLYEKIQKGKLLYGEREKKNKPII